MPNKYRKKPVVIDAEQYDGTNFVAVKEFCPTVQLAALPADPTDKVPLKIPTLEGEHDVPVGNFVIRGVKGEFYSCAPDIFAMTYDKVEE